MSEKKTSAAKLSWHDLSVAEQAVLLHIRRANRCTRESLQSDLGWTPSSVSKAVSPLLRRSVLASDPPGLRRRGAKLSVSVSLGAAIGMELGFETVRGALVESNGNLLGPVRDYRPERRQPDAFSRCLKKVVRELQLQRDGRAILGIGIGYADRSVWNAAPVFSHAEAKPDGTAGGGAALGGMFDYPVFTRCDAACAALGEARFGRLRGVEHGLFLLYEDGIGLGIVAGGEVLFGAWNDAGEIGHLPLADEGEYCQCGNIGCLETIASKWALLRKARQISDTNGYVRFQRTNTPGVPQLDELCAMAIQGDPLPQNMLQKAGRALGRALAISASLFDPQMIVLGGCLSFADAYQPLIAATKESFRTLTAHRTPQPIALETSSLAGNATLLGAAELVFSQQLSVAGARGNAAQAGHQANRQRSMTA